MTSTHPRSAWEQTLTDLGDQAEAEVKRVVAYLNDEIVPEIRRDSSRVLRATADELVKLAQRMEARRSSSPPHPEQPR